jgi:hypothetical protein
MRYEIIQCVQGTSEWFEARKGIPTASRYPDVLAQGKGIMRAKYMRQLAGEIITGDLMITYTNEKMERGNQFEPELRARYVFETDNDVEKIGFVKMNSVLCATGCSPDGLIGNDGMVEFKSAEPHILIELLETKFPKVSQDHMAQIQGNMWIMERDWCDLVIGWPKLPLSIRRIRRDETYISTLIHELKAFNLELAAMVKRLREM